MVVKKKGEMKRESMKASEIRLKEKVKGEGGVEAGMKDKRNKRDAVH